MTETEVEALLLELERAGITARAEGAKLLVTPVAKLQGELLARVKAGKAALLDLLRREQAVEAVQPPDFDETGPVHLEAFQLVTVRDADGTPSVVAMPTGWLDGLLELSAVRKKERAASDAKRAGEAAKREARKKRR